MNTEVFIGFNQHTQADKLGKTLEAWDVDGFEPIAIAVEGKRYDTIMRVAAEGLAKGDYIIAKLGTKPGQSVGVTFCKKGQIKVEACGETAH